MKKFFTNIKERTIIGKISLGIETICYLIAVTSLAQTIINIVNKEEELVGIGGTCSVILIIIGIIVKLLTKSIEKVLKEETNINTNKKTRSFVLNIPFIHTQKQYKLKNNQF